MRAAAPSSFGAGGMGGDGAGADNDSNTSSNNSNNNNSNSNNNNNNPSRFSHGDSPEPEMQREREAPMKPRRPPKAAPRRPPKSASASNPAALDLDAVAPGAPPVEDESFKLSKKRLELIIEEKEWDLERASQGDDKMVKIIEYVTAVEAYKVGTTVATL